MNQPVFFAQLIDTLSTGEPDYSVYDSLLRVAHAEVEAQKEWTDREEWIVILPVSVLVIIFGSFLFYNFFNNRYWQSGIFPPMLLNRRVNHYEAVINIATNILLCDRNNYLDKQKYLAAFLQRKFPEMQGSMQDSVSAAIAVPLTVSSIAYWLNKHTKQPDKEEMLAFFFSLASVDDTVGVREQEILQVFSTKMKLELSLLDRLLTNQRRQKAERIQSEWDRKKPDTVSTSYRTEKACNVLGIAISCTMEDVKKAYRKLAKQYHPDKFQNESTTTRSEAEAKFREVQEAYEYLETTKES